MKIRPALLLFIASLLPLTASANIIISEIMYDLEGSDSDREWVEIQNTGADTVDLSQWKFFEGDTNHRLTLAAGEALLAPSHFAVIAQDTDEFLRDWPLFSGALFDSSFSLSNIDERIGMKDAQGLSVEAVSYNAALGGSGNGDSLQRINANFIAAPPTPGESARAPIASSNAAVLPAPLQTAAEETNPAPEGVLKEAPMEDIPQELQTEAAPESLQRIAAAEAAEQTYPFLVSVWFVALLALLILSISAVLLLRRKLVAKKMKVGGYTLVE